MIVAVMLELYESFKIIDALDIERHACRAHPVDGKPVEGVWTRGLSGGDDPGLSQSLVAQLSPSSESMFTQVASSSPAQDPWLGMWICRQTIRNSFSIRTDRAVADGRVSTR